MRVVNIANLMSLTSSQSSSLDSLALIVSVIPFLLEGGLVKALTYPVSTLRSLDGEALGCASSETGSSGNRAERAASAPPTRRT